MKLIKKYPLLALFLLGFFLRLSLLFLDFSWDVNNHIAWAKDLWQRGFTGFYETPSSESFATLYPNYPPLSLFIFYLVYPLYLVIYKIAWWLNLAIPLFPSKLIFFIQSRTFLAAVLKLPAVFADLGIAWLCYLFVLRLLRLRSVQVRSGSPREFTSRGQAKNKMVAVLTASFVLFNPAFFYNSALWGQIDSIPIFFVLFSVYFLLFTKRFILSALLFVLALLVKPTAFVYLPIYLVFFIGKFKIINFLKAFFFSFLIFYFSFIPFLSSLRNPLLPFSIFSEKIMSAQSLPFVTNGAFNFWVLITGFEGIKDTAPFLFGISYRLWGYFITGFFIVFILSRYPLSSLSRIKGRDKLQQGSRNLIDSRLRGNDIGYNFFYAAFLVAFAAFLFLTKMHERYSLLPLAFLLLATLKKPALLKWYLALSLMSLLNHYHSWPVPKINLIFAVISNPQVVLVLSLSNVVLFLYLLKRYLSFRTHSASSVQA